LRCQKRKKKKEGPQVTTRRSLPETLTQQEEKKIWGRCLLYDQCGARFTGRGEKKKRGGEKPPGLYAFLSSKLSPLGGEKGNLEGRSSFGIGQGKRKKKGGERPDGVCNLSRVGARRRGEKRVQGVSQSLALALRKEERKRGRGKKLGFRFQQFSSQQGKRGRRLPLSLSPSGEGEGRGGEGEKRKGGGGEPVAGLLITERTIFFGHASEGEREGEILLNPFGGEK